MSIPEPNTPSSAPETNLKKRELSSPFSPEDITKKKTKPSSNTMNSSFEGDMSTELIDESEGIVMTQSHMMTLPETELHKLGQIVIPSVQATALSSIRNELRGLIKEVVSEVIDNKLEALTNDNRRLSNENEQLKNRISQLEQSLDDAEQYSRRNCVRLSNIPEMDSEDTDRLVLKVAETMNIDVSLRDIDRSHRIGKPGKKAHRDIIVKFTSYRARERMMKNRKNLKGSELNGVFINEDLTRNRSSMLYEARLLVKLKQPKLHGAWSSDGKILIKDLSGKIHKISSSHELEPYKAVRAASDETALKK